MVVVGLDGSSKGWVGVVLVDGRFDRALLHESCADLLAASGATVAGVDIPIGLPATDRRRADLLARARLGRLASSVFPTPVRAVLGARDYDEANRVSREACGRGLSRQTWGLVPRIREVDELLDRAPPLHEVHPEVVFTDLAGGPLEHSKKTWAGMRRRVTLLAEVGVVLPDDLGPAGGAGTDDAVDAAAVAWMAGRIADGRATTLPDPPDHDEAGRPMVIWTTSPR